jgi:hypothetical protein
MAEHCLGVFRLFGRFPRQVVLYVGEPELRMENELRDVDVQFRYRVIDMRSLDGELLLESEEVGDNVIAILAQLRDHKEAVRRIAGLAAAERRTAMAQLLILAGLRRWSKTVEEEARNMPIHIDILENEVLGPVFQKGRQEGKHEGELTILRKQIESRFGVLPDWASEKLAALSPAEMEDLSVRVLHAESLDILFS